MGIFFGELAEARTGKIGIVKREKMWVTGRDYHQSFYVLAAASETEDSIRGTIGVPTIGTHYEGAYCISHDVKELTPCRNPFTGAASILCEVTCEFTNDISGPDADQEETEKDPEDRSPVVNWTSEFEEEVLEKDVVTGEPIQTRAGEQIIITGPIPVPVLEVIRYETFPFNPVTLLLYGGRINSAAFYGAPEGTAWLQPIEAPEVRIEGKKYVHATYRVRFKMREDPEEPGTFLKNTWRARLLHQGQQYLDDGGKPVQATDENGNPIRVNLDDEGKVTGTPQYLNFNRLHKINLNDLNLGPYVI